MPVWSRRMQAGHAPSRVPNCLSANSIVRSQPARYANTWKVGEKIEPIDTVAGRFYTVRVERSSGSQRLETYWYSPRIRYWVRLEDYSRGYVEELVEYKSWSGS